MAKSTVELQLWLDDLTDEIQLQRELQLQRVTVHADGEERKIKTPPKPLLALELFNDGSFRIVEHTSQEVDGAKILFNSEDESGDFRELTINDLPYLNTESIAEKITKNLRASNFKTEEL